MHVQSENLQRPVLAGKNPQAVIDLIQDRARRWAAGDLASDGRKIGLVIEGGAMRAVCSGGGAVALAHLGFTDLFDDVYATSAGVMNASYFLSHQATLGIRVYYEDLSDRRFYNPWRVWKVIDVDYVFNHVVTVSKPLDAARVLGSRTNFYVALMDQRTGTGFITNTRTTQTPFLDVLKAATAIPVFYNRTINVDGRPCMDGGLCIPFPIEQAVANGCTDLLVLLTHSRDYVGAAPGAYARFMFNAICGRRNVDLRRLFAIHHENEAAARAIAIHGAGVSAGVNIATVCMSDEKTIHRTTSDAAVLRAGAIQYGREVLRIFNAPEAESWTLAPLPPIA